MALISNIHSKGGIIMEKYNLNKLALLGITSGFLFVGASSAGASIDNRVEPKLISQLNAAGETVHLAMNSEKQTGVLLASHSCATCGGATALRDLPENTKDQQSSNPYNPNTQEGQQQQPYRR
jgi:hypothetical protein